MVYSYELDVFCSEKLGIRLGVVYVRVFLSKWRDENIGIEYIWDGVEFKSRFLRKNFCYSVLFV